MIRTESNALECNLRHEMGFFLNPPVIFGTTVGPGDSVFERMPGLLFRTSHFSSTGPHHTRINGLVRWFFICCHKDSLTGRHRPAPAGWRFLPFGMLTHNNQAKLHLEQQQLFKARHHIRGYTHTFSSFYFRNSNVVRIGAFEILLVDPVAMRTFAEHFLN